MSFMNQTKSEAGRQITEKYIHNLEQDIMSISATQNAKMIKEHLSSFQSPTGSFSQTGLWM